MIYTYLTLPRSTSDTSDEGERENRTEQDLSSLQSRLAAKTQEMAAMMMEAATVLTSSKMMEKRIS